MNIDKAIRKQKKSYKRFLLSMCFIFFTLPTVLFITREFNIFYITYLIIIEALILIALWIRVNKEYLKFSCNGHKLQISLGVNNKKINLICSKVLLVHVEDINSADDKNKDFKIIIIASSKFRSDRMIPINLNFLKNHPYVAYEYNKIKILHPEHEYYYTIIRRGGLNKYPLLDVIYINCVYGYFTVDAVEKIKFYRENSKYYNKK
ncbi:hypothetical protein [Clostridium sp. DJ247]|uniref:hypothetical protein n=1 Tax=Clostridium sp. DJ247 TaxID=2726188 RepID=UPI0016287A68|nr:hypothetical protein [Clostridium sp. DJ247]MBC2579875.1 hypothetical protein [Clostridium sp. DJ247]